MDSIKRTRKRCGFSLTEVSARTGLHREVIARAERAGSDARARTLAAIARALGVPVCELFEVTGHERAPAIADGRPPAGAGSAASSNARAARVFGGSATTTSMAASIERRSGRKDSR